jgi:hypothetical protein
MALLIEEKYFEMLQEIFLDRLEKIKMSKDWNMIKNALEYLEKSSYFT